MKRVALDSNLLLLLVVGLVRPDFITRHRRLHPVFSAADFDILSSEVIGPSAGLLLFPNILTECSNLLEYGVREPLRSELQLGLATLIARTDEIYVRSSLAAGRREFIALGLADCVLLVAGSDPGAVIVTTDHELHRHALSVGLEVVNWNHLPHRGG